MSFLPAMTGSSAGGRRSFSDLEERTPALVADLIVLGDK
jgi:hypothetical protein